ncbi:MAG: c-type cytochrome [Actinomycetota bacterium]
MIGTSFAIDSRVATAIAVVGGLAVFGILLVATAAGELRGRRKAKVPPGFRPGPGDEELESKVLIRYMMIGGVTLIVIALWLPAYWWHEPARLASKQKAIAAETVDQGKQQFVSLCAQCHGTDASGGIRDYVIDGVSHKYAEPPLKYIYDRYTKGGRNQDEITQIIYDAINRGRPGTPMPTWGLAFGGPLNSRQVDTIVAFLQSIQEPFPEATSVDGAEIFSANCAICHGANATGGVGPNLTVALQRLTRDELAATIMHGRLNINRPSMPSWAALGDPAVEALVQFIESIQVK